MSISGDKGDTRYRKDLLTAFNLKQYDDELVKDIVNKIYDLIFKTHNTSENINNIHEIIKIVRKRNTWPIELDDHMCITMLFSYDYFFLFHECVKAFLKTNKIEDEIVDKFNELFA
tara:strand:+ start:501 stop:848 length:348 start_codon:yes stop_codon:yes gene_type:complete